MKIEVTKMAPRPGNLKVRLNPNLMESLSNYQVETQESALGLWETGGESKLVGTLLELELSQAACVCEGIKRAACLCTL